MSNPSDKQYQNWSILSKRGTFWSLGFFELAAMFPEPNCREIIGRIITDRYSPFGVLTFRSLF